MWKRWVWIEQQGSHTSIRGSLCQILRGLGSHWSILISEGRDMVARVRRVLSRQEIVKSWTKENGEK